MSTIGEAASLRELRRARRLVISDPEIMGAIRCFAAPAYRCI
jgi:hypothetical protein